MSRRLPVSPPEWTLPRGVDAATWTYAQEERLAQDEQAYFAGHPLLLVDLEWLERWTPEPGPAVDLGCGTGRAALALARRSFLVVAVDLSWSMLRKARESAKEEGVSLSAIRANICDLRVLPTGYFRYALMLFSTLGMVRGRAARRQALTEAARVVEPGGSLILHAHNVGRNLLDRQGRAWWFRDSLRWLVGGADAGDHPMLYRSIPNLVVHQFRAAELRHDLQATGWSVEAWLPLHPVDATILRRPWLLPNIRAGGWLVHALHSEGRD